MDNIFEILIYAFIIISFLSSLFKKKKKENKAGRETPEPPQQTQSAQKTSQEEEYDLLKEIEKMFKTETSYPGKQEDRNIEKGEERFEPASEHFETTDWHEPVPSEHRRTASEHIPESWGEKNRKAEEKRKQVNAGIVKQAQMFEKHLAGKLKTKNEFRNNIVQRFKDPRSLKEYIIFSEILGKPKALQE
jgi:hypothetical protein